MKDNKFCTTCKLKIDETIYKKDRTVCKSCYNKKEKKIITVYSKNQESRMLTIKILFRRNKNMRASQMFSHLKIIPLLFLAQETEAKLITC